MSTTLFKNVYDGSLLDIVVEIGYNKVRILTPDAMGGEINDYSFVCGNPPEL